MNVCFSDISQKYKEHFLKYHNPAIMLIIRWNYSIVSDFLFHVSLFIYSHLCILKRCELLVIMSTSAH